MSDAHLSQLTFDSLNVAESLKQGIAELGFTRCTPIQAQTLPEALAGHDVAGQAQTGTGKTAAFLVALFNRLLVEPASPKRPRSAPRAIVIAPTRELAVQIHSDAARHRQVHRPDARDRVRRRRLRESSGARSRKAWMC